MRTAVVVALICALPCVARAQTVGSVATAGSACDSSGVQGISDQLVALQLCRMPGAFVDLAPHTNIVLTSSHVHAVMNSMARDAVWTAAGSVELDLNSVFRTLPEQYVLYNRSACLTPASPGTSAHESGRALDVNNYSSAGVISALTSAGCAHSSPTADPVHFDCPGPDVSNESVRTFQHLWNVNNPGDTIAEDGLYGPMTEARLMASPAGGFAIASDCGTTCTPHCMGTSVVGADCASTDCAPSDAMCTDDALGVRCTSLYCTTIGDTDVCLPDGRIAHCHDGTVMTPLDCAAGTVCLPTAPATCAPLDTDAGLPPVDLGSPIDTDLGTPPSDDLGTPIDTDAATPERDADTVPPDGGPPRIHHASNSCCGVAGTAPRGWGALLLALPLIVRRRRRFSAAPTQ